MDHKKPGVYRDIFKARIRRSCGCDMRSYMSAGRRAYDLEAAKAAGIYVPTEAEKQAATGNVNGGDSNADTADIRTSAGNNVTGNTNSANSELEDTVFEPGAAREGTVVLYKKNGISDDNQIDVGAADDTAAVQISENNPPSEQGVTENSDRVKDEEPLYDKKALSEFAHN